MLPSSENVAKFAEYIRSAPDDPKAERFVRIMLGRVAHSCPLPVLIRLAECLLECRRAELRGEAERN